MTDPNCRRWTALAERDAAGEPLSEPERRWYAAHAAQCRACAGKSRVWAALGEVAADRKPVEVPPSKVTPSKRDEQRDTAWSRLRRKGGWGLAAVAVLAAGVATARWRRVRPEAEVPVVTPPTVTFVNVSGEVQLGSKAVRSGDTWPTAEPLRTGRGHACVAIDASVTACLDADSEARLSTLASEQLSIQLERGRLISRLDKQPDSRRYIVQGSRASITAQGTEFVAAIDAERRMTVHLYEGRLAISRPSEQPTEIVAPSSAIIRETLEMSALSEQNRAADRNLLQLVQLPRGGKLVELDIVTRPLGANVAIDALELGPTPLSALVQGGRRLSVSMPGYATVTELLPTEPVAKLQRNYELSETVSATPASARGVAVVGEKGATPERATEQTNKQGADDASVTPQSLLERAHALRTAGRVSECATTYRQLVSSFPSSDEARVSLMSLGELELAALGQPARALRSFESYLRQPGPLTREARFGRIRALRMLRRSTDEQKAIAAFLKDYPNSAQAELLRTRKKSR